MDEQIQTLDGGVIEVGMGADNALSIATEDEHMRVTHVELNHEQTDALIAMLQRMQARQRGQG